MPFKGKGERANGLLDLIHTDVCGLMSTHASDGFIYFITFVDDHSRYGYLNLMSYKSEAFEKFKEFINEVEKQLRISIKTFRSDRGGEYLSQFWIILGIMGFYPNGLHLIRHNTMVWLK